VAAFKLATAMFPFLMRFARCITKPFDSLSFVHHREIPIDMAIGLEPGLYICRGSLAVVLVSIWAVSPIISISIYVRSLSLRYELSRNGSQHDIFPPPQGVASSASGSSAASRMTASTTTSGAGSTTDKENSMSGSP
jgi:hypothetical protein